MTDHDNPAHAGLEVAGAALEALDAVPDVDPDRVPPIPSAAASRAAWAMRGAIAGSTKDLDSLLLEVVRVGLSTVKAGEPTEGASAAAARAHVWSVIRRAHRAVELRTWKALLAVWNALQDGREDYQVKNHQDVQWLFFDRTRSGEMVRPAANTAAVPAAHVLRICGYLDGLEPEGRAGTLDPECPTTSPPPAKP